MKIGCHVGMFAPNYLLDSVKEALSYGYWSLILFLLNVVFICRIYFYYKKILFFTYKEKNVESIEYVLDFDENRFILINKISGAQMVIYNKSIKNIYFKKHTIILMYRVNTIITVPNTEEIKNFILECRNNI